MVHIYTPPHISLLLDDPIKDSEIDVNVARMRENTDQTVFVGTSLEPRVISRFRPEVDKNCALLGYDTSTQGREDNIKIDIK